MATNYRGYSRSGSTAFQRKLLNRRLTRITRLADAKCKEIAEFIAERANALAPVDAVTPDDHGAHLKGSYQVEANDQGSGYVLTNAVRYWMFVEFGTKEHGDAQPHLRPAVDEARARWKF